MSLGQPILDALDVLQILHNSWCWISIIQLLGSITRSLMSAEVRDGTGALCSYRLTGSVDCTLVFVTRSVTSSARSSGHSRYRDHVTNPRRLLALLHYYHLNNKGEALLSAQFLLIYFAVSVELELLHLSSVIKGFTMCVVKSEGSPGCRERLCRSGLVVGAQSGRDRVRSETHSEGRVTLDTSHTRHGDN